MLNPFWEKLKTNLGKPMKFDWVTVTSDLADKFIAHGTELSRKETGRLGTETKGAMIESMFTSSRD